APCDNEENLKMLLKLQTENGIKCCSYGTYFRLGVTPLEELQSYINAAKILGTDILRLWCSDKGSAEFTNAEKQALFAECQKAAKIAEKHNVKICMECHNWTYTDTLASAIELLKAVSSPNFRMYWQPNQLRSLEENLEYAEKISPYVEIVHVFNWKGKEKLPLADGVDTWRQYLESLKIQKPLLLEFMPDGNIETLKREADALREIVRQG
ncbi:MAG: sugar phosphate isomerase/epimerase family protein, partial [Acutalibacteraceae bacterium]